MNVTYMLVIFNIHYTVYNTLSFSVPRGPMEELDKTKTMYIVGLDVETFGPNPKFNPLVAIGAAIVDVKTQRIAQDKWGNELLFHTYVCDEGKTAHPSCMLNFWKKEENIAMYTKTLNAITARGTPTPEEAYTQLVDWIQLHAQNADITQIVTDTAGFDASFLNAAATRDTPSIDYILSNPPEEAHWQPVVATDSFALGISNLTPVNTLTGFGCDKAAFAALRMATPKWSVEHDHNPSHDAATIALNYAALIKRIHVLRAQTSSGATASQ